MRLGWIIYELYRILKREQARYNIRNIVNSKFEDQYPKDERWDVIKIRQSGRNKEQSQQKETKGARWWKVIEPDQG